MHNLKLPIAIRERTICLRMSLKRGTLTILSSWSTELLSIS